MTKKIYHFKHLKSVAVSPITLLCHGQPSASRTPSTPHAEILWTWSNHLPFPPPSSHRDPIFCFLSLWICLFRVAYISEILQYLCVCAWPLSPSLRLSRFAHTGAGFHASFPFMAEWHPIARRVHWWTFGPLPPRGDCERCLCETSCARFCLKACFRLFCVPLSFENAGSLRNLVHGLHSSSGGEWAVARVHGEESALEPSRRSLGPRRGPSQGWAARGLLTHLWGFPLPSILQLRIPSWLE